MWDRLGRDVKGNDQAHPKIIQLYQLSKFHPALVQLVPQGSYWGSYFK